MVDKIAVGYCRVSTDKQREESLDNQQREIQKYANEQGIRIIGWYRDYGHSGTTTNRPELKRMIKDSAQKNFNLVLVWKLDRFSRDLCVSAIAKSELKKNGVSLFSVIERIDNTPEGQMMESMFEMMSSYYVKNLARNVLGGMKENALNGLCNGSCTYGYQVAPKLDENGNAIKKISHGKERIVKTYVRHPKNSEAVKLIFELAIKGFTRNVILEQLKIAGYKNAKGKDFIGTNVDSILRNERYTGVYTFEHNKGKLVNYNPIETIRNEGGMPKIIEKETFELVQILLDARKHKPNAMSKVDYLLTGKVVCGECGEHFSGSTHSKNGQLYHYYRCKRGNADCKVVSIRKEPLEEFVIGEIKNVVYNEKFISPLIDRFIEFYKEKNSNNEIVVRLEKAKVEIDKKISNMVDAIATDGSFNELFQSKLDSLTNEKAKILEQLKRESGINLNEFITKEEVRRTYFKVLNLLKSGETENKATIINTLLNRIIVYKDRVEVFINILPHANSSIDLQITNKDLETYGLLEPIKKEKTAQKDGFPSDNSVGVPGENRTHICRLGD